MSSAYQGSAARSKVMPAAIALLLTAIINLLCCAAGVVIGARGPSESFLEQVREQAKTNPQVKNNPDVKPEDLPRIFEVLFARGAIFFGVDLVPNLFILIAAIGMIGLRWRGVTLTGSILAVIPCFSPCCLLGIPIGIWALVVLNQADVRQAFQRRPAEPPLEAMGQDL